MAAVTAAPVAARACLGGDAPHGRGSCDVFQAIDGAPIDVAENVWIGAGATILPGVASVATP